MLVVWCLPSQRRFIRTSSVCISLAKVIRTPYAQLTTPRMNCPKISWKTRLDVAGVAEKWG